MRLHIGGKVRRDGWKVLNVNPGPNVDIVANCNDLGMLEDSSCSMIYASHVVEHLDFTGELVKTLSGFHRVLKPGGHFLVSVPNLEILCRLFLDPELTIEQQFMIMRLMYGAHADAYDVHHVGFNQHLLGYYLAKAGFTMGFPVHSFGLFEDTSDMVIKGLPISLNMTAIKKAA